MKTISLRCELSFFLGLLRLASFSLYVTPRFTNNPLLVSSSSDTLNDLPYLDAVVRETVRLRSSVSITLRCSAQDNVLPLSVPVKNIKTDQMIVEIPVAKVCLFSVGFHFDGTDYRN